MIIVSHDFFKVQSVVVNEDSISVNSELSIGAIIYELATKHQKQIIIWCHDKVKNHVDLEYIQSVFNHNRLLFSYNPSDNFLPKSIGYVEDSPFINVNKKVQYPTWQMSSYVGAIKTETILLTNSELWKNKSFDFSLNSVAKTYQATGLFCYSDAKILKNNASIETPKANTTQLFLFVIQLYKAKWIYLLLLNFIIYEKKFPAFAFLNALLQSKKVLDNNDIIFGDSEGNIDFVKETIDVIIPTIGRKKYLYDVLCDLKTQTHLPQNVIIVEQNPVSESTSELDYISNENWPFKIKHIFTHQTGACQARNKALKEIKSKWCFFADDDIVLAENFLKEAIENKITLHVEASIFSCLQANVENSHLITSQTTIFGSGCSIVLSQKLEGVFFNEVLEFGFGEDTEFGLQLRNRGVDIVYFPKPEIIHLKAPIGGFRTKFINSWELELVKPKPSPTIMYVKQKYYTKEQNLGYKTVLFLKSKSWNIFNFLKGWQISEKWAKQLHKND